MFQKLFLLHRSSNADLHVQILEKKVKEQGARIEELEDGKSTMEKKLLGKVGVIEEGIAEMGTDNLTTRGRIERGVDRIILQQDDKLQELSDNLSTFTCAVLEVQTSDLYRRVQKQGDVVQSKDFFIGELGPFELLICPLGESAASEGHVSMFLGLKGKKKHCLFTGTVCVTDTCPVAILAGKKDIGGLTFTKQSLAKSRGNPQLVSIDRFKEAANIKITVTVENMQEVINLWDWS